MVSYKPDDWEKPRSQGNKLTQDEIAQIRVAFNCGRHAHDIARELQCSSRTANKYYAIFRGHTKAPREKRVVVSYALPKPQPEPRKSRFYTSTFEL